MVPLSIGSTLNTVAGNLTNVHNYGNVYVEDSNTGLRAPDLPDTPISSSSTPKVQIKDPLLQMLYDASVSGAPFDSQERFPPPMCLANTRTSILTDLNNWAKGSWRSIPIYWLYGPAGCGKSAIAQTFAEQMKESNNLAASFFFSRQSPERNSERKLIATLAHQISISIPSTAKSISKAIKLNPSILSKAPEAQARELLIFPNIRASASILSLLHIRKFPKVIILDGLDECIDTSEQLNILKIINDALEKKIPFLFFIASRPEPNIRHFFRTLLKRRCRQVALDDEEWKAQSDIRSYLNSMFTRLRDEHPSLPRGNGEDTEDWPNISVVELLVQKSSGNFIYATTVIKFISDGHFNPAQQLDIILGLIEREDLSESPYSALDLLYSQILSLPKKPEETLRALAALLTASSKSIPTIELLEALCILKNGDIEALFYSLHSIVGVPEGRDQPIILYHASLSDFLLDESRSHRFFVDITSTHASLFQGCRHIWSHKHLMGESVIKYASDNWHHHLELCDKEYRDFLRNEFYHQILPDMRNVLGAVLALRSPPTISLIAKLYEIPPGFIRSMDPFLNHVLKTPSSEDEIIELCNHSDHNWLLNRTLSGELHIDLPETNSYLFRACLRILNNEKYIKQDPKPLQYAENNWYRHLELSTLENDNLHDSALDEFYTKTLFSASGRSQAVERHLIDILMAVKCTPTLRLMEALIQGDAKVQEEGLKLTKLSKESHLRRIISFPSKQTDLVLFHHPSFRSYLKDSSRSRSYCNSQLADAHLFHRCITMLLDNNRPIPLEVHKYVTENWHCHYVPSPSNETELFNFFRKILRRAGKPDVLLPTLKILVAVPSPPTPSILTALSEINPGDNGYNALQDPALEPVIKFPSNQNEKITIRVQLFSDFLLKHGDEYFINLRAVDKLINDRCTYIQENQDKFSKDVVKYVEETWYAFESSARYGGSKYVPRHKLL